MATTNDGGPAFPTDEWYEEVRVNQTEGMSLRDWFAGQALVMTVSSYVNLPESAALLAKRCYAVADAMLEARNGTKGD